MLKRFIIENFSSYKEENTLDLTAGRTEIHPNHTLSFDKVKILKSAIIYGANASGKSNLIKAISYAKEIITKGLNNVDTYKKYFRLDKKSSKKPTLFEFEFELNDRFFSYGFSSLLDTKEINEEWLFEIGKASPKMIFERKKNKITLGKILNNPEIKTRFEIYVDDMKNQSGELFLSEIANKNLDKKEINILNDIYHWFDKKLVILYPDTQFLGISSISSDDSLSKVFKRYLNEFDTGICDILQIEDNFEKIFKDQKNLKKEVENSLSKKGVKRVILRGSKDDIAITIYKNDDNEIKVHKLGLVHNKNLDEVFELKDESDGTKRLFDLIPLIEHFKEDYTILIDEFDRSLHPKLARKFFELFYQINDSKSQLIVTTHESNLLDLKLVRRDEIWFAEKDKHGASKLFSLNQFKVRYDSKIEKAYLLGRYGAIPIFKTFDEIDLDK